MTGQPNSRHFQFAQSEAKIELPCSIRPSKALQEDSGQLPSILLQSPSFSMRQNAKAGVLRNRTTGYNSTAASRQTRRHRIFRKPGRFPGVPAFVVRNCFYSLFFMLMIEMTTVSTEHTAITVWASIEHLLSGCQPALGGTPQLDCIGFRKTFPARTECS